MLENFFATEVRKFSVDDVGGWPGLAKWFGIFWASSFWGEHLRCTNPQCNGVDMYSKKGTLTRSEAARLEVTNGSACPRCENGVLEYFWNPRTTEQYVTTMQSHPGYCDISAYIEGKLAGWIFSYKTVWDGKEVFYVDTIAILPDFRDHKVRWRLLLVFWSWLFSAWRKGYRESLFRTHEKARHVARLAEMFGYRRTGKHDPDDEEREFWLAKLSLFNFGLSLAKVFCIAVVAYFPLRGRVARLRNM